jgi:peptidoglycan L-alanyl-D-glutamate endopeptidase CwlK
MFKFSNKSLEKLATVHKDLQLIMNYAITRSNIDFGISFGYRSPDEQFELFKKGRANVNGSWIILDKSKVVTYKDGFGNKSRHNLGEAVDVYAYFKNYKNEAYNKLALTYIAGIVRSVSEELYAKNMIEYKVISGINWDDDEDFMFDQSFMDYPHFELDK